MRFLGLLMVAIGVIAGHAHAADEAATDSIVVLRGSSAPPTPWNEPPPEPAIIVQQVYLPAYSYLPFAYGPFIHRHHHHLSARRNR